MRTSALPFPATTTTDHGLVATVRRHAATLKDALRRSRSLAKKKQTDPYVTQLAKDALSRERSKCVFQVTALVVDLAMRGSLEDAEAIGLHLSAIARAEHAAAHPDGQPVELSIQEAHLAEERAEGAVEEAETGMAHNPGSLSHELAYLSAAAVHQRARRELDAAVRRSVAKQAAGR